MTDTDWVARATALFAVPRPEHFTDFTHCCECEEHDQTLVSADIDTISLHELGHPSWDPMCFATLEARKYYLPAQVRLSLETMGNEFYLAQFLFHLQWDGHDNPFYQSCNDDQRYFIASFLEYLIATYPDELEQAMCVDDALSALQIWSAS